MGLSTSQPPSMQMNAGIWGATGLGDVEAADSVRAGAQQGALVGRACELGSLSHLPLPPKLMVFSACPSLSDPISGVGVRTFLDNPIPWHCNSTRRLKRSLRWCLQ